MKTRVILIVDDQAVNRKILRKLLETDYTIIEAENGQKALEMLRENAEKVSAVLLDIVMPVLDGYGVLEAMQRDAQLCKIPVVVSSQMDGDEAEEKALGLGAQDFIAKPYKATIIKRRLNNIINLRETAAIINRVEKDELTGVLSKQFFLERADALMRRSKDKKYDIIALGIEHFKLINDTYGTVTGDSFLRYIATVLQEHPEALLVSRFSADKFYALLQRPAVYDENLFKALFEEIRSYPIEMDININCGIYQIEDENVTVNTACDRAQLAADINKGRYDKLYSMYDDSMRQKLVTEQFIAGNMRTALSEHQFHVYYQPKYDLNNERLAGAEALVRWIHPTKGFMSPGEFIPIFEHNGFITQLDEYVWETACRDIHAWLEKGFPAVAVSVNVSRADVYNPKLADILLGLVAKYQIPLRCLHLEITESAYTNNPEQIIKVVSSLRELGFVIEMDDFGSGYSSLNMLSEMPVDVLKLDMGFVQHETGSQSGKGIMSFVISLAKWLDLAVVAEGVETAEQIATLRSMDCNYVQGFYFARPMKREDFEELLTRSNVTEMVCNSGTMAKYNDAVEQVPMPENGIMLVVDDIEVNRAVLASAFEDEFTVVQKANGQLAWEYLQTNADKVAVIMLDLLMPVMDGFQLLEKIRGNEKTEQLPVIITSQGNTDSELRALRMQADDFISKPYSPEIVRHRVRNAIEVRRLHQLTRGKGAQALAARKDINNELSSAQKAMLLAESLKPYFDIVRLVDPENTLVHTNEGEKCDVSACYSVWGKQRRCNNCISLRALREKGRACKLEYSAGGLYFVISQYVPYDGSGAIIEMVTRLDDEYVDNILDKPMLYSRLDALNEKLNIDELTGVFNRHFIDANLDKYIQSALARGSDLGVAMVDLDAFKSLNDLFGHEAGDNALRGVAKMLRDNIAQSKGDFVARYGGDEFLVACCDIPRDVFYRRLAAVSKLVKYITDADGRQIPISISAGCISLSEVPAPTASELINRADRRLYKSKVQGRGLIISAD